MRQALPGGFDIVGMYVFCPGSTDYTSHLRQLLYSVCGTVAFVKYHLHQYVMFLISMCTFAGKSKQGQDQVNGIDQFDEGSALMERIAVHMCSASKKCVIS